MNETISNIDEAVNLINSINSDIHLIIAVGLPNSGKSTIISKLKFDKVFSYDDRRVKEYCDFYKLEVETASYNKAFQYCCDANINIIELEKLDLIKNIKNNGVYIVDGTHISKKSRANILNIFSNKQIFKFIADKKITVTFLTTLRSFSSTLNQTRKDKYIPLGAYKSMVSGFMCVTDSEYIKQDIISYNNIKVIIK